MNIKILVPDMHCEHCVNRIEKLFQQEGISFSLDLPTKMIEVDGREANSEKAVQCLVT